MITLPIYHSMYTSNRHTVYKIWATVKIVLKYCLLASECKEFTVSMTCYKMKCHPRRVLFLTLLVTFFDQDRRATLITKLNRDKDRS